MKKITKRERFESLLSIPAVASDPGLVEFINHEIELLAKKNSGEKKLTPQQTENETIKASILNLMTADPNRLFSIGELLKEVPNLPEGMTSQRMTAIVRQMYFTDHTMVRVEEKRKAYFKLA